MVRATIVDFHCASGEGSTHPLLLDWVHNYFKQKTGQPPLYLQHQVRKEKYLRYLVDTETFRQGCLKFLILPMVTEEFIKSVGEESQVVKRGREYHGCGEKFIVEKRERGNNIIFTVI